MAVVLVVAVQPVGAADSLKQVVVAQFVIQVDVAAARRVKAGQQLAHHDQQLQVGRLLDETAFGFILVRLGGLALRQHMQGVGVELIALVAVGRLPRNGVVVGLVRGDDAAVLAKARVLEQPKVVAGVVDRSRHQDGCAAVVV